MAAWSGASMAASRRIHPACWHSPKKSDVVNKARPTTAGFRKAPYGTPGAFFRASLEAGNGAGRLACLFGFFPAVEVLESLFGLAAAFFMQSFQLLVGEILDHRKLVGYPLHRQDQFRQLQLNRQSVAVLGVL